MWRDDVINKHAQLNEMKNKINNEREFLVMLRKNADSENFITEMKMWIALLK